jgi:anti-anti-sigma factor
MMTAQTCEDALAKLDLAPGELVLDLSAVRRIDPSGLRALDDLAAKAHQKAVKVVLGGVHIDVYRVLKLMKIERRFTFM